MAYDDCVKIERAANGFTVTMKDQKVAEQNMKREIKSNYRAPWVDPMKTYVFTDFKGLSKFLEDNLEKALPKESFDKSFDAITASD